MLQFRIASDRPKHYYVFCCCDLRLHVVWLGITSDRHWHFLVAFLFFSTLSAIWGDFRPPKAIFASQEHSGELGAMGWCNCGRCWGNWPHSEHQGIPLYRKYEPQWQAWFGEKTTIRSNLELIPRATRNHPIMGWTPNSIHPQMNMGWTPDSWWIPTRLTSNRPTPKSIMVTYKCNPDLNALCKVAVTCEVWASTLWTTDLASASRASQMAWWSQMRT